MTASPCRHICQLDPAGDTCLGCGRTLDEIAGWGAMTDDQQQLVLRRIEQLGPRNPGQLQPTQ